jgi:hypothetical protein
MFNPWNPVHPNSINMFDCEYAILAAVPSAENLIIMNSNAVKKTGNAKMDNNKLVLRTIFLVITTIKAKDKERTRVIRMAGTNVATDTR